MWWPFRQRSAPAAAPPSSPAADPFPLDVAILSDRGNVRTQNEDRGRCVRPGDAATLAAKGVLVLVADGMGGHEAGEVASTAAAETVAQTYYGAAGPPDQALRQAFEDANGVIYAEAQRDAARSGMGTTCTALVVRGADAVVAHVGDSRLYRLRGGRIEQLTEDHSVVGEMVRDGLLTPAEARSHESRNVITRALGIRAHVDVAVAHHAGAVAPGDAFVLSSDGMYDLVEDHEIAAAGRSASAHEAAGALVELAKARGGYDNVTVAVVRVLAEAPAGTNGARSTREAPVPS